MAGEDGEKEERRRRLSVPFGVFSLFSFFPFSSSFTRTGVPFFPISHSYSFPFPPPTNLPLYSSVKFVSSFIFLFFFSLQKIAYHLSTFLNRKFHLNSFLPCLPFFSLSFRILPHTWALPPPGHIIHGLILPFKIFFSPIYSLSFLLFHLFTPYYLLSLPLQLNNTFFPAFLH